MLSDACALGACAAGIYACFISYGILHESIYHTEYGPEKETFHFSLFLVFLQSVCNGLLAVPGLLWEKWTKSPELQKKIAQKKKEPSMVQYTLIAMTYLMAMFTSNLALNFVSYPMQVLGKSVKIVPVMLARILINGARYTLRDYLNVGMITAGITAFMYKGGSSSAAENTTNPIGIALLVASLALDAYTGPAQENLYHAYAVTSARMQWSMNLMASNISFLGLLITKELPDALKFINTHPGIIPELLLFCFLSACGQWVILQTVERFGALTLTVLTTTRKFFTILASVIWFRHKMSTNQWIGVSLVFLGLILDALNKKKKHTKKHHHQPQPHEQEQEAAAASARPKSE